MTQQFAYFSTENAQRPWRLWNPDPGEPSFSANFYTPVEPYYRKRWTVTDMKLADRAETDALAEGYVTLPELPESVVAHWAEADAKQLAGMVAKHLAERP